MVTISMYGRIFLESFGIPDKTIEQLAIMPADNSSLQDCLRRELTLNGINGVMQQIIQLCLDEDTRLSKNLPKGQSTAWKHTAKQIDQFGVELKRSL